MTGSIIRIVSAAASQPSEQGGAIGQSVLMLAALAMLLGAFLLVVSLMTVIRRRRQRAMQTKPRSGPLPNPWQESAGRLQLDPPRRGRR